jgi:hypothetical protein
VEQLHRFLNICGGYVRSVDSYSLGAGRALMPHIVTDMDGSNASHTSWSVLAEHTQLFVTFGGVPSRTLRPSAALRTAIWSSCSTGAAAASRVRSSLRTSCPALRGLRRVPGGIAAPTDWSAQTCLVQARRYGGDAPPIRTYQPPDFVAVGAETSEASSFKARPR